MLSGPDNFYKFHNFYKLHDFDHSNEFNEFNEFNGRDVKFQLDRDDKESLQSLWSPPPIPQDSAGSPAWLALTTQDPNDRRLIFSLRQM